MKIWSGFPALAAAAFMTGLPANPPAWGADAAPFDQSPYERPASLVEVGDGQRLNLVCRGEGFPTVLLEAGFGESAVTWRDVQPEIAKVTRVCAYDRAGLGFSDPARAAQDVAGMAARLRALVDAGGIGRPFVLVAHSMGGLIAARYADENPRDLAGLVLVDPAVAHQERHMAAVTRSYFIANAQQRAVILACLDAAKAGDMTPGSSLPAECGNPTPGAGPVLAAAESARMKKVSYWEALLSEHENMFSMQEDSSTVDDIQLTGSTRRYGTLPLIVLTAGNALPDMPEAEKDPANTLWMKLHDELAARSDRGVNRLAPQSGHYIQNDAPQEVIAAVLEVVTATRR
ncbi:MAG: alpha/beta fold hydrolase [Pseudochelatococcus sp.]|jgi:pimeloyl-ACP methyl ester carboxylesterase|uniref:alpha/beta fold hydrolase n=1 Tax=Pseudochelatococcus sp. TaxID=2020869 RepID=UPI003D8C14D7